MDVKLRPRPRQAKGHRPPLHVCLAYLLVCTMLATGLSFSRYATTSGAYDTAQVAAGALSVSGSRSAAFDLDCNDGTTSRSYTFTVTNQDGGKASQVAIEYDIVVKLSQALPHGVTMKLDGQTGYASGTTYTFSGDTFAAGKNSSKQHTLTITADANKVTGSEPHDRTITISVQAEQID